MVGSVDGPGNRCSGNPGPQQGDPIRICVVAPTLDILGGQSIQAEFLVSHLRQHGVEVNLLPVNPVLPRPFRWLQRVKYLRTVVTEAWYVFRLVVDLRRASIVHVFSASYLSFLLAPTPAILVAKKLYGKRVILHYHSGEAGDHFRRWHRTAIPVVRMADRIVVPSQFLVDVFAGFGVEAEAIQNFIPDNYVRFRWRESVGPVFFANRNLEEMYNVACILRAFARVREHHPEARLLVAGDGSQRRRLETLARRLNLDSVRFLGAVPPEQMGTLYDEADIYLNASSVDNQPLSILESFAAGLPVVTTSAGGIHWLVRNGENGLLVPLDDDEALAEGALRLLEEPRLAADLSTRARQEYLERYRWSAVRDRWLELYRQLLEWPIRVAIVAPSTRTLGGQAVQAKLLADRLRVLPGVETSMIHIDPLLPVGFRWLQRIKYVRTTVTELRYLSALLRRIRHADVVHIFSAAYFSFILAPTLALLVCRLYGKKTVLNYRSGEAEDHLRRWRRTSVPTMRMANRLVVGSGYLEEVFARFGLSAVTIPNFAELDRYTFRRRNPILPVFLGNRNLEPYYDVATILRAFRRIQDSCSEATLLLAGDGSQRSYLESLAEDLGLKGVTFLGQLNPDQMPALYDQADVYLNASRVDNMPTSLIEAFAAGVPVVTTSVGGIPYIVRHGENGLMVPPGDDKRMAEQALRLLREPKLVISLIETARAECEAKYTWPAVGELWIGLYRSLVVGSLSETADPGPSNETALTAKTRLELTAGQSVGPEASLFRDS